MILVTYSFVFDAMNKALIFQFKSMLDWPKQSHAHVYLVHAITC